MFKLKRSVQEQSKTYFSVKGFAILFFNEVFILITERLAGKVSTVLPFDKWGFPCIFYPFVERC